MKRLVCAGVTSLTLLLLISYSNVNGQENIKLRMASPKPVMGWSSWSFVRRQPTAAKMEAQARALVSSGLAKFGYRYVNLDDFWYLGKKNIGPQVSHYGYWVPDPTKFPPHGDTSGMKILADYIHRLGLKFGIYLTPGISKQAVSENTPIKGTPFTADQIADTSIEENNYNFGGMVAINYHKPGAQDYINSWADLLAEWGVDFIKLDGIANRNAGDIKAWSEAIKQCGRSMVLDITQGDFTQAIAPTLMKFADQWEFAPDIECYDCESGGSSFPLTSWANVARRFDYATVWQRYSVPGGYNDYDAIEIGNGNNTGLTITERKTQISLWALASAPLIIGADLTHLDKEDIGLLENPAIREIDQDGVAAKRFILHDSDYPVFAKIEKNGDAIIGLFNNGNASAEISMQISMLGLPANNQVYYLENLWTGTREKTEGNIDATVPPHGVALYRVKRR